MNNKSNYPIDQAVRDVQHFGEEGGVVPVIDVAATSTFLNPADMEKVFEGELEGCYLYSRHSNPSVVLLGKKMAAMEGTEAALGMASGMAAISSTIEQIAGPKGHVVAARTVYGGTYALFKNIFPKRGIDVTFVDADDIEAVRKAMRPNTKVLYVETLSNPLLAVSDLSALSSVAQEKNVKFVVDNTFAPLMVSPRRFGADAVIHSCTKYISGASDLIAGAVCGSSDLVQSLIDVNTGIVMLTGPVMDPRVAHELYLRLDHLSIRMQGHSRSAMHLAHRLLGEKIAVIYPGLESHVHHERIKKYLNPGYGFGGMMAIDCQSPRRALDLAAMLQKKKFGLYAVSLGFSRTLMSCPSMSTSSEIPEAEQKAMNLSPGLLRLSIGYTGDDEVMADRFVECYRKVMG